VEKKKHITKGAKAQRTKEKKTLKARREDSEGLDVREPILFLLCGSAGFAFNSGE
jgi:hypothetical protein